MSPVAIDLDEPTEAECRRCGRMFLSRGEAIGGRCSPCMDAYLKAIHEAKYRDRLRKPKWDCGICFGSGWEVVEDEGVGAARRCRCSVPDDEQSVEYWLDRAGVPQKYFWKTLGNWQGSIPPEVKKFLAAPEEHRLIFISGLQGRGKTHLGTAVFRELLALGKRGLWRDIKNWCATLRSAVGKPPEYDFESKGLRSAEIALLDDFGRERPTDFAADEVELLVRERHSRQLVTIVTSQWTVEQLVQPAPRGRGVSPDVCSRLSEGLSVCLEGKDWRRA